MFQRKMTLTARTCRLLEGIRLALEVLLGAQIRIKQIEFEKGLESGRGEFYVNDQEVHFLFVGRPDDAELFIDLRVGEVWYVARFDSPRKVRVIARRPSVPPADVWRVGTSFATRWEEQLHTLPPLESR